jgi:heme A synthase
MPILGLILLVVSFFAAKSVPGARKWGAIVFGLIILQVALALFAFSVPALGALHGINALAVLGTAIRASMLTRENVGARTSTTGGFDVPQQASGSSAPESSRPVI